MENFCAVKLHLENCLFFLLLVVFKLYNTIFYYILQLLYYYHYLYYCRYYYHRYSGNSHCAVKQKRKSILPKNKNSLGKMRPVQSDSHVSHNALSDKNCLTHNYGGLRNCYRIGPKRHKSLLRTTSMTLSRNL